MEDRRATVTDALQSTTFRLYSSAAAPVTGEAPRHPLPRCQSTKCRPGTPSILKHVMRSRSFLRKGIELSNTVSYVIVVLNYLFGVSKNSQLPFLASFVVWLRSQKQPGCAKSHVLFALRIMGFPQELETVRLNSEPKRCKNVSLSAKRSVLTLVGLTKPRARSSNGETAFSE